MKDKKQKKTCSECIHEYACSMWTLGNLHNTDATHCVNYETVKDSAAYLIGRMEGEQNESNQTLC